MDELPFRPFPVFDPEEEVPSKADLRAMSRTMVAAAWATGKALRSAGLKDCPDLLGQLGLVTAGRCVEYDEDLDAEVMAACAATSDLVLANKILREGSRPSLFLTQLPNLISANISIVHGVKGRSQTLFGEELAGAEAIGLAVARVATGDAEMVLVGGASSGEGRLTQKLRNLTPASRRIQLLGSAAGYCVVESETSATKRGHRPLARVTRHSARPLSDDRQTSIRQLLDEVARDTHEKLVLVISGGTPDELALEHELIEALGNETAVTRVTSLTATFGSIYEASAIALLVSGVLDLNSVDGGHHAQLVSIAGSRWATFISLEVPDA